MKPSERWRSFTQYYAERVELPPDLIFSQVMAESAGDPKARSPVGACGLLQLMPATWVEMHVTDPFDPDQNVRAGTEYLAKQKAFVQVALDGRPCSEDDLHRLALAAYNAGFGYVREAVRATEGPITWASFAAAFQKVTFRGKKPDWKQALNYAERILPSTA